MTRSISSKEKNVGPGDPLLHDGRGDWADAPSGRDKSSALLGFGQAIKATEVAAVRDAHPQGRAERVPCESMRQAGPRSFSRRIGRPRDGLVNGGMTLTEPSALTSTFEVVGGFGSFRLRTGPSLHEFLGALFGRWRRRGPGESTQAGGLRTSSSFNLETWARRTARSLNCRSSSAFSAIWRLSSFSRSLSRPRTWPAVLRLFDLGGQIGDGGAEINGLLIERLVLCLQSAILAVALGGLLLAGFEAASVFTRLLETWARVARDSTNLLVKASASLIRLSLSLSRVALTCFCLSYSFARFHPTIRQRAALHGKVELLCCRLLLNGD